MRAVRFGSYVPTGGECAGLRFTVANNAGHQQVGVVESGAVSVHQGVAQFAAFIDGAWRLRRDMAGNAAGEGKLGEQAFQALLVLRNVRIHLAVAAFQRGVGHETGAAMTPSGPAEVPTATPAAASVA